jgi:hypothetical protein
MVNQTAKSRDMKKIKSWIAAFLQLNRIHL